MKTSQWDGLRKLTTCKMLEPAARKSLADAVIGRLPGGYDQMLGRRFETGVDLSGGEWQKVALARAYLRDAQLLSWTSPRPRSTHAAIRGFPALRRTHRRQDGALYFAPIFNRTHGRPHRSSGKRKDCRRRKSRPVGAPGRTVQGNV